MKHTPYAFTVAALALAGCGDNTTNPGNPDVLFLAPNGSEVIIQLIDHEPDPW